MIYIDEIKDLKIYKHNFLLPRNGNDKRKNNAIFLLTPNYESSKNLINHPLMINNYYNSYFLDKNVMNMVIFPEYLNQKNMYMNLFLKMLHH